MVDGGAVSDIERRLAEIRRRLGPLTRPCGHDPLGTNSTELARRLVELIEIVDELADPGGANRRKMIL